MKTYIFTVKQTSPKRGYNRTIDVYRVEDNQPLHIGYNDKISTSSYKGDYAIACDIISDFDKLEMTDCGYYLKDKNIKVIEIR